MIQTSSDLQKMVLSSIIHDPNLFGSIIDDVGPRFFSNVNYQVIYKILHGYYQKYHKVPEEQELQFMIQQNHNAALGNLIDIQNDAKSIYHANTLNPAFVLSAVETFIKRAKLEELFSDVMQKYESDKSFTFDSIMEEFMNAYNYTVTDVECMRLDDFDRYTKLRQEIYGSSDSTKIIKSFVPSINQKLTYKGYKPGDLVTVVAAPGVGKTTFLINEGLAASIQGFNVLHVYLGDMNEITAANRYMACLTGLPINHFSMSPENYQLAIKNDPRISQLGIFNRIFNVSYPPSDISTDKLRAIISKLQQKYNLHFDLLIIDYADNLAQENEQMYQNGGEIYNKLKGIAVTNRSVLITASQPQRTHYDKEIIPFEGIAESSKKLHIVDLAFTLGKATRDANVATLLMAKVREGETGGLVRLGLDLAYSRVSEITESEYLTRKGPEFAVNKPAPNQYSRNRD